MPSPIEIMSASASLMNDSKRTIYTDSACLPYLNIALDELQEIFEQNGIPVTNETSKAIRIPTGVSRLGFDTTPALPSDLIEIKQLWESPAGQNTWTQVNKKDVIPHYMRDNTAISQFLVWELEGGRIQVIPANAPIDLKIDYVGSLFNTPVQMKDISVDLPFVNIKTYLEYKTAALMAMFIAENPTRATALDGLGFTALTRALGIPIKGMQAITTRRRPFRSSHKRRGISY